MNRKIFALFALTAGMHLAVHASENVNTTENRQFLKQQENLSRQLREKPDHQLKAWAEKQVLENPFSVQITIFWMSWFVNSRLRRTGNPAGCPVFCVVFHTRRGAEKDAERNPALRYSRHAAGHGEQRPEGHG